MAQNPVCAKCSVAKALNEIISEYADFTFFLRQRKLDLISDHARGYCHGQMTLARDVITEITNVIPHVQAEAKLRAKSDKGL